VKPSVLQIGGILLLLLALGFFMPICCGVGEDTARRAFDAAGLENPKLGGYAWLRCSEDDSFKSYFTATNAKGAHVEGVICCGLLKSCTLRF